MLKFIKVIAITVLFSMSLNYSIVQSKEISFDTHIDMAIFISKLRSAKYSQYADYAKLIQYQESLKIPDGIPYDEKKALYEHRKNHLMLSKVLDDYFSLSGIAKKSVQSFIDFFTLNPSGMYSVLKENYDVFINDEAPEPIKNARKKCDETWKDVCFVMSQYGYTEEGLKALAVHFSNNKINTGGHIQNTIGCWFVDGKNYPYSIEYAIAFFELAVKEKNTDACINLSKLYYFGGFSKKNHGIIDHEKALHYAHMANRYNANQEGFAEYYSYITRNLRHINDYKDEKNKDDTGIYYVYIQAANDGDAEAQGIIGRCFEYGTGERGTGNFRTL